MTPRLSVFQISIVEIVLAGLLIAVGSLATTKVDVLWYIATMVLVHFLLFFPIGLKKGFDFVIYDAPADSLVKYYGYFAIFMSAFAANGLDEALYSLLG